MNSERWRQIQEVYHSALSRPAAERRTFLSDLGGIDSSIVQEVEALLAANDAADAFLGTESRAAELRSLSNEHAFPVLEHYELSSLIGSGGMGVVYRGRDKRLNRQVAIKVLPPAFAQDRGRLMRFEREARAASMLNHPNIVTIYEVGTSDRTPFIAAEFIEGQTLRARMDSGRFDLTQALHIAIQAAQALDAAHTAGIVHRDIKPENVMMRSDGFVKVLDFGIAKMAAESIETQAGRTEAGGVIGTPRYMSPEQACGRTLDGRSDIFSLATVVYEMATGEHAFPGTTQAEIFAALLEKAPAPLADVAPDLPLELDAVLAKALSKLPEQRQQSMREFADELHQVLMRVRSGVVWLRPSPARAGVLSRRAVRWTAGLAAAVVLTVAALAVTRQFNVEQQTIRTVPFASFAGSKDYATLSPDGSRMAFTWDGGRPGPRNIYIKASTGEPARLTPLEREAFAPAWSPDGRSIAYIAREPAAVPGGPGGFQIYVVPVAGGPDRKVGYSYAGVSWSPDNRRLAVATKDYNIAVISLDTGAETRLTSAKPMFDSFPEFSPDGKSIAFLRGISAPAREVYIVSSAGGTPRQVTWMKRPISRVMWTANGSELIFSAWGDLWRTSVNGGQPQRVQVDAVSAMYPAVSRKGDRLAFTESYTDQNIWRYDGPGFGRAAAPGLLSLRDCLLCSTREDNSPNISPDGKRIVFVSKRSGYEELWVAHSDGDHLKQLTFIGGPATGSPRWSPDGRWIAFDSRPAGYPAVYVISSEGGELRQFTTFAESATVPAWSSDGEWIYYVSPKDDRRQIFKRPVGGGDSIQVTRGGATDAFESPDGKLLYFARDRGIFGLWSVPAFGGEEKPVPELKRAGYFRSWGVTKQGIYFAVKEDQPRTTVRFFSFATRRTTAIATIDKAALWSQPGLAVAPDGRFLLWAQNDLEVNNIKLVEGFR